MNWKWPSTKDNYYLPWYTILAKSPGGLLVYLGFIITFIGLLMVDGWRDAAHFWTNKEYI